MRLLPAEWAPQDGVLLTWPHEGTDWADDLGAVETCYAEIAAAVAERERVVVVCRDEAHRAEVASRLRHLPPRRLLLATAPSDDTWARDHGPLVALEDGRPVVVDFRFDGWGGKYPAARDDAITARLHEAGLFGEAPREPVPLVLEGGAVDSDGAGTLLAAARCVLDPRRNPGITRAAMEEALHRHLGVRRILWVEAGALAGDDTDGHIDTLARFCSPADIAYVAPPPPGHRDRDTLRGLEAALRALRRADGSPYRLHPLPPPPPLEEDGRPLPASHANFLVINGAVLLPTYGSPADETAAERLRALFPGRQIVGIDCRALVRQNGSLHCVTMQLPAGSLAGAG
ncbi:agmatine deiminase family protein [Inmirania thermothiophila]|uniref:Agmatine deiminase n=1 Tax=Inmirania thermothiophila TaxID=1750597 RepID=A0A3N1Y1H2_9GAMM|nr:agmatine deiminase family protein [Inmirania thermothiophila]ROR32669.1 agmatine deiminase [Inmirania thermothiophila]